MARFTILCVCLLILISCTSYLEDQTKLTDEEQKKKVVGKTTQTVKKYDPSAGQEISDSKIEIKTPLLAPLGAYGPAVEKIAKVQVGPLIDLYNVQHGRYPSYEEFQSEIIKNGVRLPVLPGGKEYQYWEEEHKLVIVEPSAED